MRACRLLAAAALAAAAAAATACTNQPMRELPITAAEMPASFAYGGLGPEDAHYRRGVAPRSGADIRHMVMTARDELAVFVVMSLGGDSIFSPAATRRRLDALLPPDQEVAWGQSTQTSGMHPTKVTVFALPARGAECVGLERSLRAHPQAGSQSYSQSVALGYYCRSGPPFTVEEALRVAAALRAGG